MKIGNRLLTERQDRKINQTEMAELLGLSPSSYSRIERNEGSVDLEQIIDFSQKLNIPIQDFLPDTISINTRQDQNGQIGLVMGSIYNYYNYSDKEIAQVLTLLAQENTFLKEKNSLLEKRIADLERLLEHSQTSHKA